MAPQQEPTIPLLTPFKLGKFELSHRIVLPPLTRCRAINTIPQPAAITYYTQRATKGGLLIAEGTCISQGAHGYPHTPGLYTKEQIEAWKPIVKAVKDKGAYFFVQIWHVGRASHQEYQPNQGLPVSSSAIPVRDGEMVYISTGPAEYPTPRALAEEEIPEYVEQFRIAARNAIEAGFDGVEIHGANGYLIDQFLKDGVNKRTDKYGGSLENRTRFCREVIDAVVDEVGAWRVGLRLSPFGGFLDVTDSDPYATNLSVVEYCNKVELLYLHLIEPRVGGNNDRELVSNDTIGPFRKAFKGATIAAGGYKRDNGNEAILSNHTDLISYGRLFLANPDLPRKFELGAPLNKYDRNTFYTQDQVVGYLDYPFLDGTVDLGHH